MCIANRSESHKAESQATLHKVNGAVRAHRIYGQYFGLRKQEPGQTGSKCHSESLVTNHQGYHGPSSPFPESDNLCVPVRVDLMPVCRPYYRAVG